MITRLQLHHPAQAGGPSVAALQGRIDRLSMAWSQGNLSDSAYTAVIDPLKAQLVQSSQAAAPAPLLDLDRVQTYLADFGRILADATLTERRQIIPALFKRYGSSTSPLKQTSPHTFMVLWAGLCIDGAG